jgi:hypothetical protein
MAMDPDRSVAPLAVATGAVAFVSVVSLALFFAVGKPFGAINDWTIGVVGFLSGLLALALTRRGLGALPALGTLAGAAAVLGAVIVIVGAALVISQTTGFLLAGLVESLGFALIGLWLIALNRSMASDSRWPRRLLSLGIAAGIIMATGMVVIPGIVMALDDMNTAPGWIWIGFVGWFGIFFLYPIWSIWLGSVLRRGAMEGSIEQA